MEICWLDLAMMCCGVMFGEVVVAEVLGTFSPVDKKLFLAHSILDPVEAHVHCFGFASADGSIGNTRSGGIVYLNGCRWLWVSHFN
jgi:hypothetical protein